MKGTNNNMNIFKNMNIVWELMPLQVPIEGTMNYNKYV